MSDDREPDLFDFTDEGESSPASAGETDAEEDVEDPETDERVEPVAVADLDREGRVELGVELLRHLDGEPSLAAVVDRLETVTTDPSLTREILDTAEKRGVVERDGARLRVRTGGTVVAAEPRVVRREGEFDCRRCGAGISTGHFVRFESGELGPFGSSCVQKVLGRE